MSSNDLEQKILDFQKDIHIQEQERVKSLYKEMNMCKKTELEKYENNQIQQMNEKIQAAKYKMHMEYTRKCSNLVQEMKKDYHHQRNKLMYEIFEGAKQNLIEYCKTSEYKDFLLDKIKDTDKMEGDVIFVKKEDMAFADDIKKAYGSNCDIQQDEEITIGGFRLENIEKGICIDESLEYILSEQAEWFFIHSGLSDL